MNLGIFAKTFVRPTVEEVFAAVARHRLRWVQFNFACAGLPTLPDAIEPGLARRIGRMAASHRIGLAAVSGTFNMIHPDPKARRNGLRQLGVLAGACEALGTTAISICTGTRDPENMWRRHPDNDRSDAWDDLLVTLTKALTTADKHNVTLLLEPEVGNVVDSARTARRVLDEMRSPRLKVILDPANLFHPGDLARGDEILEEAFDVLGPDIAMAHAKELSMEGEMGGRALGEGVLNWEKYVTLLRQADFEGPLILHGVEEKDVAASLRFLRDLGI